MKPALKFFTLLLFALPLTQCALFGPAGPANNAGVVSAEMSELLKPNTSGLNFPVYTKYAEVEPFFRQKNDNITYIVNSLLPSLSSPLPTTSTTAGSTKLTPPGNAAPSPSRSFTATENAISTKDRSVATAS